MEVFDVLRENLTEVPREGRKRDYFRASEVSSCPRKVWYSRSGYPVSNPFDWKVRLKMDMGTQLHPYVLNVINKDPRHIQVLKAEYDLDETYEHDGESFTIHCRPDGLVRWRKNRSLLEIKTTSSFGLKSVRENFGRRDHYSWGYVVQAALGAYMTTPKVPWLMIVVACFGDLQPFEIKLDEEAMIGPTFDLLAQLERSLKDGEPPERPYTKSSWQCRGCTHRDLCWGDLDVEDGAQERQVG